ncbi:hypothetical protein C9890_0095 [Perkinsus sp. BL_2016]|nr:hypothetical protein C9890_0095 [Perkinsus sp. BL_2016]
MDLRVPSEPQAEKENEASNGSSTGGIAFEKVRDNPAGGGAPSPNTLRKRRREAIAKKVESRKALMTTASSSRLDMSKVHSILSGPRLSWDWQSAGGNKNDAEGEEDDSCGLIVDFHQDSRSALRTHISKAMSQMASKEISSQSIPSSLGTMRTNSEDIKQIIQMKRNLIASQATQLTRQVSSPGSSQVVDNKDEEPPALEPIHPWQETQMPAATQIFIQVESPIQNRNDTVIEEEIDMDDIGFTQVYCPEDDCAPSPAVEKTQVYVPLKPESVHHETKAAGVRTLKAQVSKASSTISIPPNDEQEEIGSDVSSDGTPSPRRKEPKTKSSADELSFEEWLEARKNRKRAVKKQSKEARSFFEAEAEESEDEEFGGIIRRGERGDESGGTSSSDDDGDSDLEDLVASARDEFDLLKQSGKDSNKLAKLHAKWIEEKDAELEKAIENQDFWKKKRTGLGSVDDGTDVSLMNRMQRKLKAKHQAFVQQYDAEGNPLAPEYASDESDYDSMEIDSDEFYDDEISGDDERELDPQELALRQERREREKERRRRDLLLKMEMDKRRQLLKAKLRAERLNREKDKREIQAGCVWVHTDLGDRYPINERQRKFSTFSRFCFFEVIIS